MRSNFIFGNDNITVYYTLYLRQNNMETITKYSYLNRQKALQKAEDLNIDNRQYVVYRTLKNKDKIIKLNIGEVK